MFSPAYDRKYWATNDLHRLCITKSGIIYNRADDCGIFSARFDFSYVFFRLYIKDII